MWSSLVFVLCASVVVGQRLARQDDANGWDIRLAVPGEPGSDYPTLGNIPRTSFSCAGKTPGYYADTEANCQVFRICTLGSTYGFQSFLCPNGTLFNQAVFVCDWWMNVNCDSVQNFPNTEKFGNLRLGPQLMSDVKKMLTHPMRNPYDKSAMKSNLIVMQEYKPPTGQLAFSGAQIQGPKKMPENVYLSAKLQQQSFGFNRVSDNLLAGSTPGPHYAPPQNNAEVFQRQVVQPQNGQYVHDNSGKYVHNRQNNQNFAQQPSSRLTAPSRQYVQSNVVQSPQQIGQYRQNSFQVTQPASGNIVSNGLAGRLTQASQFTNNNGFLPSTQQGNYQYNQPVSTQNAQLNNNFFSSQQLNNGKQKGFEISYSKQQFNANQEKQPYNYNAPQFSNEITGQVGNDAKQNLALVFSFLADSINQAKEYNTIAEQTLHSTASANSHFQNVDNAELAQITNKVAQLTSAQYSNNKQLNNANIQGTNSVREHNQAQTSAKYTNQPINNNAQHNASPQTRQNVDAGQYDTRYQSGTNNFESNENQIYSGQLYQIPVPDVSSIYSGQSSAKLIMPSNVQQHTELADLQQHHPIQNGHTVSSNNLAKQSSAEVEIVQSQSLPPAPAKLQAEPGFQPQSFNSQEDTNVLGNFVPDSNGITAQLSDKIVSTIAHPSEENKLVTYKKDQSYYVYTKFDHGNNVVENFQSNQLNPNGQQSGKLTQSSNANNGISFQLVPSVSYQLDDEKDKQRILNAFQIDEFGSPRVDSSGNTRNNILSNNVNYAVQHQQQQQNQQVQNQQAQYNTPNNLYTGPSSYSAPQASVVGRLEANGNNNNAAKLEQFEENSGYSKTAPGRSFSF